MPKNHEHSNKPTTRHSGTLLVRYDKLERVEIGAAINKLAKLRGEGLEKYPLETWISQFEADRYPADEVLKILDAARHLKKYSGGLAYGDLISHYKETTTGRIDWDMVWRGVAILSRDSFEDLNEISIKLTGLPFTGKEERGRHKKLLDQLMQDEEDAKRERLRQLELNEARIFEQIKTDNGLIEQAERVKKDYAVKVLEDLIKRFIDIRAPYEVIRILRAAVNNLK